MLQEKISLLSVQLLDKEKETEVLAENNRCKKCIFSYLII